MVGNQKLACLEVSPPSSHFDRKLCSDDDYAQYPISSNIQSLPQRDPISRKRGQVKVDQSQAILPATVGDRATQS